MEFGGLNERQSPHQSKGLAPNEAITLDNARPNGGLLEKVKGSRLHSVIAFEATNRPSTLVRFSTEAGAVSLWATAWRALFRYSSGTWLNLMQASRYGGNVPANYYKVPNYRSDSFIYRDALYLTDGQNYPIKAIATPHATSTDPDYNANGTLGTWGLRSLDGAAPLLADTQVAAGTLANNTYTYYATLYDVTRQLEGNLSALGVAETNGGANDIWVYVDKSTWNAATNYSYENEFADKIRIYRDKPNGATTPTLRYLVASLDKGLIDSGTCGIDAAGNVTGVGTHFTAGMIGFALYAGANAYRIDGVTNATTCHVVDPDGSGLAGAVGAGADCKVFAGVLDTTTDILTGGTIYFGDDTSTDLNTHDHSPPPNCKYCLMVGERTQRALVAGNPAHPNRVYWSHANNPDYFYIPDEDGGDWIDIEPDDGDAITALIRFQGRVYVFKRNSVAVLYVDGAPGEWTFAAKVIKVGAIDKAVIADCDGVLVFASAQGAFAFDGSSLKHLSHRQVGSQIQQTWAKIAATEWVNACAVYNRNRREWWLSVCLDDARGLYDSAMAGLGDGTAYSPNLWEGTDNPTPPQNNIILVYQVDTDRWFRIPAMSATCWTVFDKKGDANEVYGGDIGGSVKQYDIDEAYSSTTGDGGVTAAGSSNYNLIKAKSHRTWVVNEWAGGTVVWNGQSRTVISNTTTTLTIGGSWSGSNPLIGQIFEVYRKEGTLVTETGTATGSRAYYSNTATGGSSATLIDTAIAITPASFDVVVLRPGLATEEIGIILVYISGSKTMTFASGTWDTPPSPGDTYQVWRSLADTTKVWTPEEHNDAKLFLRPGTATAEQGVISHNSARVLACDDFNDGSSATDWTSAPVNTDPYTIFDYTVETQTFQVHYATPMLHFGNMADIKAFIDLFLRVYGTGTMTVSWVIDGGQGGRGGTMTMVLAQSDSVWGDENWGTSDDGSTLIWGELGTMIDTLNFPDNAEGYFLQLDFTITTGSALKLYFWSAGFHRNTGTRWQR